MTLLNTASRLPSGSPGLPEVASVVREHLEAIDDHDLDQALRYLSPDLGVETAHLPGAIEDRRRFAAWLRAVLHAFPDLGVHVVDLKVHGDTVLARWVVTGTFKAPFLGREPTGERLVVRGLCLDTVEGGKIRRRRLLWDTANALMQLKVVPVVA